MDQFNLLDRIDRLDLDAGEVCAMRNLTLAEDYLADHFPGFPVMPGVMMLEAMTQAAAWWVRARTGFAYAIVVLKEARNVRYASFLNPGETLYVEAALTKTDGDLYAFRAKGLRDGRDIVSARIVLRAYNLADSDPAMASADRFAIGKLRERFDLLTRGLRGDLAAKEALQ